MMNIKWSESLLTGYARVDEQHKEIFKQAEIFLESGRTGKSKEQLNEMLSFLESYINRHFALEEELQKKYDYPDYGSHKLLHDNYKKQYWDLRKQYNLEGAKYHVALKAIIFTIDWLSNHIDKADKSMAGYIKNKVAQKTEPEVIPQQPAK
jgi:hemerythrin